MLLPYFPLFLIEIFLFLIATGISGIGYQIRLKLHDVFPSNMGIRLTVCLLLGIECAIIAFIAAWATNTSVELAMTRAGLFICFSVIITQLTHLIHRLDKLLEQQQVQRDEK